MNKLPRNNRWLSGLLLAALLVVAQASAVVHAFQHDAGVPQTKACKICIAAAQLGFGALDTNPTTELPRAATCPAVEKPFGVATVSVPAWRQRGPPRHH